MSSIGLVLSDQRKTGRLSASSCREVLRARRYLKRSVVVVREILTLKNAKMLENVETGKQESKTLGQTKEKLLFCGNRAENSA